MSGWHFRTKGFINFFSDTELLDVEKLETLANIRIRHLAYERDLNIEGMIVGFMDDRGFVAWPVVVGYHVVGG